MRAPRKYSLTRELIIILIVKCALLGLIWRLWFAEPIAPSLTPTTIAQHIYN
jgi:hypothetical protein